MHADRIVDILLGETIDPGEFIDANPEMLDALSIDYDRAAIGGDVAVHLEHAGGTHTYIGSIRKAQDGTWYAWEVNPKYNPSGRYRSRFIVSGKVGYHEKAAGAAKELKAAWDKS